MILQCSSRYLMCLYRTRMKKGSFMYTIVRCGSGQLIQSRIHNWRITFIGMRKWSTDPMANLPPIFSMSHGLRMHSGMLKYVFRLSNSPRTYSCCTISRRFLMAAACSVSFFTQIRPSYLALAQPKAIQLSHVAQIFPSRFEMGMVLAVGALSGGYQL